MGWYIFFGIIVLLSIPLFIPVIVKAKWDEEEMDWSVHVGFLQIAPDTKARIERWKKNFQKVAVPIAKALKFIFGLIAMLIKGILWPLKKIAAFIKSRKKPSAKPESDDFDFEALEEPEIEESLVEEDTSPVESEVPESENDISLDEEETVPSPELETTETIEITEKSDSLQVERTTQPTEEEPEAETKASSESEQEEKQSKKKKGFRDPFASINAKLKDLDALKQKFDLYLGYYRQYSPLGKKILKKVFRLVKRLFNAFHFQRLKIICKTGGDPAVLGAISGWHYALGYTIHPNLPERIVFLPDYEEHSVSFSGSLNISVWIWPIRFVLPTLAFIFGLPWIQIYKTVRAYRKGQGQSR